MFEKMYFTGQVVSGNVRMQDQSLVVSLHAVVSRACNAPNIRAVARQSLWHLVGRLASLLWNGLSVESCVDYDR